MIHLINFEFHVRTPISICTTLVEQTQLDELDTHLSNVPMHNWKNTCIIEKLFGCWFCWFLIFVWFLGFKITKFPSHVFRWILISYPRFSGFYRTDLEDFQFLRYVKMKLKMIQGGSLICLGILVFPQMKKMVLGGLYTSKNPKIIEMKGLGLSH